MAQGPSKNLSSGQIRMSVAEDMRFFFRTKIQYCTDRKSLILE